VEENESVYIELAEALELYAAIIGGTTGQAADQLRDQAGLESALGRPRNYAHYQEADLALQAAALAHGVAESQAFIDGNKRLALVSMLTFLEVNGVIAAPRITPRAVRPVVTTRIHGVPSTAVANTPGLSMTENLRRLIGCAYTSRSCTLSLCAICERLNCEP